MPERPADTQSEERWWVYRREVTSFGEALRGYIGLEPDPENLHKWIEVRPASQFHALEKRVEAAEHWAEEAWSVARGQARFAIEATFDKEGQADRRRHSPAKGASESLAGSTPAPSAGEAEKRAEAAEIIGRPDSPDTQESCRRCGRTCAVWFAASPLWNAVIRGGSINNIENALYDDMVCASCFMDLAEERGIATRFRVTAEEVNVELETVTPSGRVWDEERFLWIESSDVRGAAEAERREAPGSQDRAANPSDQLQPLRQVAPQAPHVAASDTQSEERCPNCRRKRSEPRESYVCPPTFHDQPVPPEPSQEGERCPTCGSTDRFIVKGQCASDQYEPDDWHRDTRGKKERWWVQRYDAEHADEPDTLRGVIGVNPVNEFAWIEVVPASQLHALEARLADTEHYAAEGWSWLDDALDALGVKDVFKISEAKQAREAAEAELDRLWEVLKEIDRTAQYGPHGGHSPQAKLERICGLSRRSLLNPSSPSEDS